MFRVPFAYLQFTKSADFDKFGQFALRNVQTLVKAAVGEQRSWAGFAVTRQANDSPQVQVSLGVVTRNGKMYSPKTTAAVPKDFTTQLPLGARKYAMLVAYTVDDQVLRTEDRSVLNQETGNQKPESLPVERGDVLELDWVLGQEALNPQIPPIEPNVIPIAYILLNTTQVESVTLANEFRLLSLEQALVRIGYLEDFERNAGAQLVTLKTELTGIKASIPKVSERTIWSLQRDVGGIKKRIGFVSDAAPYDTDFFLTDEYSATGAPGYAARVEEGIRFPFADQGSAALARDNPQSPQVVKVSGLTMAPFVNRRMLDIWGRFISVPLSNYQGQAGNGEIYPGARRRRRFGTDRVISSQSAEWQSFEYLASYLTETYAKGSEDWAIVSKWEEDGVQYVRLRQYWDDRIPYWANGRSQTFTVGGFSIVQTWLNPQPMVLTQLGLWLTKVDPAADLHIRVGLCDGFLPNLDKTLAATTIPAGAATQSDVDKAENSIETLASFKPTYLKGSQRYWAMYSSASDFHFAARNDNRLTQGTLYYFDGGALIPDPGKDINQRVYGAEFKTNRVSVELNTVALAGGITDIDILSDEITMDGTEIYFEARKAGEGQSGWRRMSDVPSGENHKFADKPAQVQLRMVMEGTTDLMPMIDLENSLVRYARTDDQLNHISVPIEPGFTVDTVNLEVRVDQWDDDLHDLDVTVLAGGHEDVPTADTVIPMAGGGLVRRLTYALTTPSASYQVRHAGSSSSDVNLFTVAYRTASADA